MAAMAVVLVVPTFSTISNCNKVENWSGKVQLVQLVLYYVSGKSPRETLTTTAIFRSRTRVLSVCGCACAH